MEKRGVWVAAGSFDAMHKGHMRIIEELADRAGKQGVPSLVICEEMGEAGKKPFTTMDEKRDIMKQMGIDEVLWTKEHLRSPHIWERAGKALGGEVYPLGLVTGAGERLWMKDGACKVIQIPWVRVMGQRVTNELVRDKLAAGWVEDVERLCGRPYSLTGVVEHGKALGRTVGMPTANLGLAEEKQMPLMGVYATSILVEGQEYRGVTNVGRRPTVDDSSRITIETYLLDFSGNLYDCPMKIGLHHYLRPVKKFDSLEEVRTQVKRDIAAARSYWERSV